MMMFIEKPLEEMTLQELQRERRAHLWLANSMERLHQFLLYRAEQKANEDNPTNNVPEDLAEMYINGIIDDEEYATLRRKRGFKKHVKQIWLDRIAYCEAIEYHHRAFCEELRLLIEERQFAEKEKPKKERQLPKVYGYDPRRNKSKNNYPRDDWGKTRENRKAHKERKGK